MPNATATTDGGGGRPMDPLFTLHAGPGHAAVGGMLFGDRKGSSGDSECLGLSSSVSAVCFVRDPFSSGNYYNDDQVKNKNVAAGSFDLHDDDDSESSSDDDDEPLQFRCSQLLLGEDAERASRLNNRTHDDTATRDASAMAAASSISLRGGLLASAHANGKALIWDLGTRRVVSDFADGQSRGPGLALRRMAGDDGSSNHNNGCHRFMYHSRGRDGVVSVHEALPNGSMDTLVSYRTSCQTFCAASSCAGGGVAGLNLLALPTKDECSATVVDVRVDPTSQPAYVVHGAALANVAGPASDDVWRKHGMLTSLSLCATGSRPCTSSSGMILACGMESGSVFFHDLTMPGKAVMDQQPEFIGAIAQNNSPSLDNDGQTGTFQYLDPPHCSVSLGKDPVLCLDVTPSSLSVEDSSPSQGAVIAVAGCAGDADDLAAKEKDDQKTVAVIKGIYNRASDNEEVALRARIRSRVQTCEIGENTARGKPGVGICRFRPDGRIFAVGGWDRRLRLFSRSAGATPLALMKTHIDSVTAIDWAPDTAKSGILATGSEDGQIAMWRAFPHTDKKKK